MDDLDHRFNLLFESRMAEYRKRRALLDPLSISYKPSPLVPLAVRRRIWPWLLVAALGVAILVWACLLR